MCEKKYFLLVLIFIFLSCKKDDPVPSSGTADFTEYISIGNSLTAGYSDGGLYREAQMNSYPAILAGQLSLNSGMEFLQPLMPVGNGSGYIELLAYPENGFPVLRYLDADPRAFEKVSGPFHNLGVPGLRVKDIEMKDYGTADNNQYFYRILPAGSETQTSYLDLVESTGHSFFTCWIGNNDVLGYATEGGYYGENGYGDYGRSGLTPVSQFSTNYSLLMSALTKNNAQGVLLTIPDILYIPYFNLVSNADFPNFSDSQIEAINKNYSEQNALIEKYNAKIENDEELSEEEKDALYRETIHFDTEGNSFIIEDKELPDIGMKDNEGNPVPKMRRLKEGEKITVPGILEITQKLAGINKPLGDRYVLTLHEIQLIDQYRSAYNDIIRSAANNTSIALLDIDGLLAEFKDGKNVDGVFLSTDIVEGGIFSLDGIHLTQRGYALVANKIIEKINGRFGAEIPKVNLSNYKAVDIP